MKKYRCIVCGYVYDPVDNGNIAFENLPDDWTCPECGVGKDQFEELQLKTGSKYPSRYHETNRVARDKICFANLWRIYDRVEGFIAVR